LVGNSTLPIDKYFRTLGLHRAAAAALTTLDADVKLQFESFVKVR
jgi:acyl-homoserine lactone acylase PvdQ